jgi:hypothetical protein
MKLLGVLGLACLASGVAFAQQPGGPPSTGSKPATCQSQYAEAPAYSSALLLSTGFEIKAAVPGGLWLQKQKDVYFCNSGRAADGEMLCWKLRVPVKGQPCQ